MFAHAESTTLHLKSMSDERITEEIMKEVENLNLSIREHCPEIISSKFLEATMGPGDELNELIQHRIDLLTKNNTSKISDKTSKNVR